jgi:FMN reductase
LLIIGIGGTARADSATEEALRLALGEAMRLGADTLMFGGAALLAQPLYDPHNHVSMGARLELVEAVRKADGLIISSPGYHGSISGLVKNALDGLEDLRDDPRPYLDGRAVGLIVTADGPQAGGSTLAAMRSIVHALRGWPTPLGIVQTPADRAGDKLGVLAGQVVDFAKAWAGR